MQAVSVKCPECNAVIDARGGDQVTCTYCGTPARVQRRTQFLQRPMQMPPMRPTDPHAIAVVPANKTGLIVLAVVLGVLFTVVILIVGAAEHVSSDTATAVAAIAAAGPAPEKAHAPYWRGGPPLVLDADGDGTDDVIGIRRYLYGKDAMALMALSGKDGRVLWETPSLGDYNTVYRDPIALAGKVILRADGVANLHAVSATDGKPLWTQGFGEVVKQFCAAAEGVVVQTADEKWWSVELATGAHAAAKAPKPCGGIAVVTISDKMVGVRELDGVNPKIPGMSAGHVIGRPGDTTHPAIALGYRAPGTAVSMLAAIGPAPHWDKVAWTTEVAAKEPLRAKLWGVDMVALDDDAVATIYEADATANTSDQVALFARADGARRWGAAVAPRGTMPMVDVTGLGLTRDLVVVGLSGQIRGYDRATGALRWDIGDAL